MMSDLACPSEMSFVLMLWGTQQLSFLAIGKHGRSTGQYCSPEPSHGDTSEVQTVLTCQGAELPQDSFRIENTWHLLGSGA